MKATLFVLRRLKPFNGCGYNLRLFTLCPMGYALCHVPVLNTDG
jgi:hypothetical protein